MSNIFLLDSVRILNSKSSEAFICIRMNFGYDKLIHIPAPIGILSNKNIIKVI